MFFLSVAIDADDLSTEPADGHECFKVRDSEIDLPLKTVKVMLTYHIQSPVYQVFKFGVKPRISQNQLTGDFYGTSKGIRLKL